MDVTVLGCGSSGGVPLLGHGWGICDPSNPFNRRLRSSIFIKSESASLLVDTSPDVRQQLIKNEISDIDAVFYTHSHYDHTSGINELRPMFIGKKVLNVFCDQLTANDIKKAFYFLFEETNIDIYKPYININPVDEAFSVGDIDVACFEQNHGFSTSMGIRIKNFAYTTDVLNFSDRSFDLLKGIDVWIVGCLSREKRGNHANLEIILKWVDEIRPKQTFLTHMDYSMDYNELLTELPQGVQPAFDGMKISL